MAGKHVVGVAGDDKVEVWGSQFIVVDTDLGMITPTSGARLYANVLDEVETYENMTIGEAQLIFHDLEYMFPYNQFGSALNRLYASHPDANINIMSFKQDRRLLMRSCMSKDMLILTKYPLICIELDSSYNLTVWSESRLAIIDYTGFPNAKVFDLSGVDLSLAISIPRNIFGVDWIGNTAQIIFGDTRFSTITRFYEHYFDSYTLPNVDISFDGFGLTNMKCISLIFNGCSLHSVDLSSAGLINVKSVKSFTRYSNIGLLKLPKLRMEYNTLCRVTEGGLFESSNIECLDVSGSKLLLNDMNERALGFSLFNKCKIGRIINDPDNRWKELYNAAN